MKLNRSAAAGTLESSDIYVQAAPGKGQVEIQLESIVYQQFGPSIVETIRSVAEELGVTDAVISAVDRGALDCTIRARVETALKRAAKEA